VGVGGNGVRVGVGDETPASAPAAISAVEAVMVVVSVGVADGVAMGDGLPGVAAAPISAVGATMVAVAVGVAKGIGVSVGSFFIGSA
jgi:hypothetical protein